jgi:hypothetical protein
MRSKAIVQCPACGILGGGSSKLAVRPSDLHQSAPGAGRGGPGRGQGGGKSLVRELVLSTPKEYANYWRGEHQGEAAGASA